MPDNKTVTLADAIIEQLKDPMYKMWLIPDAIHDAVKRTCQRAPAAQSAGHCMCPACRNGVIHASDCAVHNASALPVGPCDCGALPAAQSDRLDRAERALIRAGYTYLEGAAEWKPPVNEENGKLHQRIFALEDQLAAQIAGQEAGIDADGWEWVRVKNLQPLLDALERAERKGYLPYAFESEWEALEIDRAAPVNGGERDDVVIDFDPAQAPKDFGTQWPPEILARRAADAQQVGGGALAGWRFEYRADDDAWVVTMPSGDSWTTFGKNPAGQLVAALTSPSKEQK